MLGKTHKTVKWKCFRNTKQIELQNVYARLKNRQHFVENWQLHRHVNNKASHKCIHFV